MEQILCDLYEVTFNDVRVSRKTGTKYITHNGDESNIIIINDDEHVTVGEPYLAALEHYGKGFKTKTIVKPFCCWLGSTIATKINNTKKKDIGNGIEVAINVPPYRMVEVPRPISKPITKI